VVVVLFDGEDEVGEEEDTGDLLVASKAAMARLAESNGLPELYEISMIRHVVNGRKEERQSECTHPRGDYLGTTHLPGDVQAHLAHPCNGASRLIHRLQVRLNITIARCNRMTNK
jgi:hypothetical protein